MIFGIQCQALNSSYQHLWRAEKPTEWGRAILSVFHIVAETKPFGDYCTPLLAIWNQRPAGESQVSTSTWGISQADVPPPRYTHSKVSKSLQTEGSGLLFKCKSPYVVYQLLRHLCKKRKTRAQSTKQIICRQRWWSQTSHSFHYDSVMNYLQPQPPWDGTSLCSNLLPPLNWNIRQNNSSKSLEKKKRL